MDGLFEQFPYTNYQNVNLGWALQLLKRMEENMDTQFSEAVTAWIDENYNSILLNAVYDPETKTIILSRGE